MAKKQGARKGYGLAKHPPSESLTSRLHTGEPLHDACSASSRSNEMCSPTSHEGRFGKRNSSNTRLKLTDLDGCITMRHFSAMSGNPGRSDGSGRA